MKQRTTRFQALTALLLALLVPAWAYALNLGDISLKSAPGEPLEAEIPLSGVSADEQDSLSVGLADVAGFRWAGIDWSPALNRLQFELKRGADGTDYIRVHSDEAVQAPLLHFLLKVAWSRGRLFREYTLELDTPPYDSGEAPAGTAAAVAGDRRDAGAAVRDSRKYEVVRNDTLWEIARELRPDSSVSTQQMMLALLRTNPDAFSYDNINWLKAGADLWMPSDFEMQARSAAEAFAEVLVQNNVWREARGLPAVDTGWLAGTGTIAVDGGLRLVPVGEGDLEDDSVAALGPDGASREQALALANEQVEELSQENIELEHNLSEAETIIEDLRRLVELKDDELAALQGESISEQAGPGPDLSERIGAVYDSATDALSDGKVKSMYDGLKDNWPFALSFLAALLALAGWFMLLRKPAHARKGFAVPAASVRADFARVISNGETVSPTEDDIREAGARAKEFDFEEQEEQEEQDEEGYAGAGEFEFEEEDEPPVPDGMDETETAASVLPADGEDAEERDDAGAGFPQRDMAIDDDREDADPEEDEVQNKLDLARAYLELGDAENVRSILAEVLADGNAAQKEEARQLLILTRIELS